MKLSKTSKKILEIICDHIIYNVNDFKYKSSLFKVHFHDVSEFDKRFRKLPRRIENSVPNFNRRWYSKKQLIKAGYIIKRGEWKSDIITDKFWKEVFLPYAKVSLTDDMKKELVTNLKRLK